MMVGSGRLPLITAIQECAFNPSTKFAESVGEFAMAGTGSGAVLA
jgi:hypothetical protein